MLKVLSCFYRKYRFVFLGVIALCAFFLGQSYFYIFSEKEQAGEHSRVEAPAQSSDGSYKSEPDTYWEEFYPGVSEAVFSFRFNGVPVTHSVNAKGECTLSVGSTVKKSRNFENIEIKKGNVVFSAVPGIASLFISDEKDEYLVARCPTSNYPGENIKIKNFKVRVDGRCFYINFINSPASEDLKLVEYRYYVGSKDKDLYEIYLTRLYLWSDLTSLPKVYREMVNTFSFEDLHHH